MIRSALLRAFGIRSWAALAPRLACGLLAAAALLAPQSAQATADVVIDNFEGPGAPAPWAFDDGGEKPAGKGSLTVGAGHSGKGAHLVYDLSNGANYVSANLTLPTPLTVAAISFWVKSPPNITIVLRVVDTSGQTLQCNLLRPLANLDPAAWYQQVVALEAASSWWGGANDGRVHSPITGIKILAADPLARHEPGTAGAIDLDDVTGLSSAGFDLDPAHQPLIPAPPGSGDLLPRLGVNIHFTNDDRALDAAQAAGFSWVRMDLMQDRIQASPKVFNWSAYDKLLNSLQKRGMKALLIIDRNNNRPPKTAATVKSFGDFAEAAARHFAGRGVCFEVWNEPNIKPFWTPPNAAQYAALAKETIARLHQGDPTAVVVTGGLSEWDHVFASGFLSLGGGSGANAFGMHPYCNPNPPEFLTDHLLLMRAIVGRYLSNSPPVWSTEWGWSSADFGNGHSPGPRKRQAVLTARELLTAWAANFPMIIYYDIRDDGTNPTDGENNFGLLANDYTDKPAMQAVKTLTSIARGHRFSGFIPTIPTNLTAMRFDGPTDQVVALWSCAPSNAVTRVTFPTNAKATDFLGAPLTPSVVANRFAWTVSEANGPIYIFLPGKMTMRDKSLSGIEAPK